MALPFLVANPNASQLCSGIIQKCKENGIHTCVDTNGYLFSEEIKEVLEITDLVLFDIKHIDPEKYLKLTEVELEPTSVYAIFN